MARYPLVIPDDLMAQIEAHCKATSAVKSKLFCRWVVEGYHREIQRYTAQASAVAAVTAHVAMVATPHTLPPAAPAPEPLAPAAPPPAAQEAPVPLVQTMANGAGTWFEINGVCAQLGITVEQLLQEIDPVDDVLKYANRDWIDERGIAEARTLCPSPATSDSFWAWAQSKIK